MPGNCTWIVDCVICSSSMLSSPPSVGNEIWVAAGDGVGVNEAGAEKIKKK